MLLYLITPPLLRKFIRLLDGIFTLIVGVPPEVHPESGHLLNK
jgi:hypothetical protein